MDSNVFWFVAVLAVPVVIGIMIFKNRKHLFSQKETTEE